MCPSADAERVMENMIQQGATIIFPQSFGYLTPLSTWPPSTRT